MTSQRKLLRQYHGRGPWLWHAMFDGTRLCRCNRSREMKGEPVHSVEHRDAEGRVQRIEWREGVWGQ